MKMLSLQNNNLFKKFHNIFEKISMLQKCIFENEK